MKKKENEIEFNSKEMPADGFHCFGGPIIITVYESTQYTMPQSTTILPQKRLLYITFRACKNISSIVGGLYNVNRDD